TDEAEVSIIFSFTLETVRPRGQLLLRNTLIHTKRTHGLAESQGWLGLKSGCTRRTPSLNSTLQI
ncbi:hypothetical protein, partial [Pseudomonas aeruginosa]|uniref:hypothetical protein n=1 Tax=Pseudomonas aeruginosa TaxID=287 RepID=UPI003D18BA41